VFSNLLPSWPIRLSIKWKTYFFAIAMRQVLSEGEAVAPNLLGATEWTWSLKRSAAPPPILGEGRIALIKKIKRRDGEI
jgi:hypothetical protein